MGLYEYDLYIVRESVRGDLLADAFAKGILSVEGDPSSAHDLDGTCLSGRVGFIARRGHAPGDSSLEILTMALDNKAFERVLSQSPGDVIDWFWQIARSIDPACFFMPGGGDTFYFEKGVRTDDVTFHQLPRLIRDGEIAVVHPIMYFAERLAEGRLCAKASGAPWSHVEHRPDTGCLLILADRDEATGALDIREPVRLYDRLRAYFD